MRRVDLWADGRIVGVVSIADDERPDAIAWRGRLYLPPASFWNYPAASHAWGRLAYGEAPSLFVLDDDVEHAGSLLVAPR